jgi:hypothetical protein
MQDDMIEASRLIDESIMGSINSAITREFDLRPLTSVEKRVRMIRVAIAKAEPFVSRSIPLGKIIDDNEIDLAIAYTWEGKLSLRRGHEVTEGDIQIDCSMIASAIGEGGGHQAAAGGIPENQH